jgi:hypothetical protein
MELVIYVNGDKDPAVTFEGGELRAHIANTLYFNVLPNIYTTSGLRAFGAQVLRRQTAFLHSPSSAS